jgi:HlyD family secretion protein
MSSKRRRWLYVLLGAAALGIVLLGFVPEPVPVEVSTVARGPLRVTSDEDAQTRARDHYAISAPVAGRVSRIELREGDAVRAGQLIAQLWPVPLSAREREEYEARVEAARALLREAEERVGHAAADHEQASRDRQRLDKLVGRGVVSSQEAEQARVAETATAAELAAARFRARSAQADLQAAQAALLSIADATGGVPAAIALRSPVDGKLLSIAERSERVVAAGSPLVVVSDPSQLEIVIDLLSTEAVKVRPGMSVVLEGWGGTRPLHAVVRVVEPMAFTKVSALGVEEQRVNVIADFVDPPGPLGDAYRVEARVVLWSSDDVLKVPSSSLFRRGEGWSVFVVRDGRAYRIDVEVGHRGTLEAEILGGLSAGERVIRHPSNDVDDGTRVRVSS